MAAKVLALTEDFVASLKAVGLGLGVVEEEDKVADHGRSGVPVTKDSASYRCGSEFQEADELREHYHHDLHRINIRRLSRGESLFKESDLDNISGNFFWPVLFVCCHSFLAQKYRCLVLSRENPRTMSQRP